MSAELASLARSAVVEELEALHREVRGAAEALSEEDLWRRPVEPGNSVGHLVLHLTGNLNHYVGAQLGGSGYVRDRPREFTEPSPPPKAEALARLDEVVAQFRKVVGRLGEQELLAPHPEAHFGPVYKGLLHLLVHFAVHRGQVSYLVRLLGGLRAGQG
jgi:uncharacterized damage-inducible protein DinB